MVYNSLTASPPSAPDISGMVKNSIRHVCRICLAEHPLFALLLGGRNILSMAYTLFWTVTLCVGIAFDVLVKGLMQ